MRLLIILLIIVPLNALAWKNGPSGNATTNEHFDCTSVPYSTHDYVAEHALALLPDNEKAWLTSHRNLFLIGTEAPDNKQIFIGCGTVHQGYDDRSSGHSVEWNATFSGFAEHPSANVALKDRAARRAQEEYSKAVIAYQEGDHAAAAFYLGAMAHYVGDVSQYGHSVPYEGRSNHSKYEAWVGTRTDSFNAGIFEEYIELDSLARRTPYTAVKLISKATSQGTDDILSAEMMIAMYDDKKNTDLFMNSVGASLNLGANTLSDILHSFFLNVVQEDEQ